MRLVHSLSPVLALVAIGDAPPAQPQGPTCTTRHAVTNAINQDQASQPLATAVVIPAMWWALILGAALSTLVR
jgi:hypothetical protein